MKLKRGAAFLLFKQREKISALVDAAEKYHLTTVASSDIFSFPSRANPDEKWELLACSLNEFLSDYPQIDWITTRFGENYSYFNDYFG